MSDAQEAIAWANDWLYRHHYTIQSAAEPVRLMPWSQVYRILTSQGYIYLKLMAPPFSIEAKLLTYLLQNEATSLPKLIATNKNLSCFMMMDAGSSLRNFFISQYQINLVEQALNIYVDIQHESIKNTNELFSLGVLDWRVYMLPKLYQFLISHKSLLEKDGLMQAEFIQFKNLYLKFSKLCETLSAYNIPETIEHSDLHDNNILFNGSALVISDWGDTVISHPFFSLVSFLDSANRHHGFKENSHEYITLRDAYLNRWLIFESKARLLEAFELTKRLWPIKFAMSYYRVTLCPGIETEEQCHGRISESLKKFIQLETEKNNNI